jgi:methyl-accepting chemotaxis protein
MGKSIFAMAIERKRRLPMLTAPVKRHAFLRSIRARLLGIIALFGVALVAIVAILAWFAATDIYAGRQDELRTVVEVASKVVQQQYDEFKKGTISEAEAQERAKASIRAMHYNANDYFFVQNKDLITIVHPRQDQEGKDGSQQKDPSGKYFFIEMHKVRNGTGPGIRHL